MRRESVKGEKVEGGRDRPSNVGEWGESWPCPAKIVGIGLDLQEGHWGGKRERIPKKVRSEEVVRT